MSRIFLSHSHSDSTAAVALHDWLREEGWDDVFLDLDAEHGIAAGERWERALHAAAQRCEAVLFVVTKGWLASPWCLKEFNLAHRLNKRLFGVLVEDIALPELPVHLTSTWQLVQLGAGRDHVLRRVVMPVTGEEVHITFSQQGLVRLRTGLQHAGLDPRFFAWPPEHDPDRPPYRGLRPLEAEDAGIFFGREAQIVEVLDRLRGLRDSAPPRLVVILGASGAGKSSFLRAGLLPRLARDDRDFLTLPVVRPERAAINGETGLVRTLEEACHARNLTYTRAAIRDAVTGGVQTLRPILKALVDAARLPEADAKPPLLLLPIDQAGSLFLAEGGDQAAALLALLRELLLEDDPNILMLVTMRSDSYERLQTAPALHGIRQETVSLPPMLHGAFQAVIEGPATRLRDTPRALDVDPELTEALMIDIEAGGSHDALPLLAFTLERLYLEYGASGRLALANYEALGRIRGSIEEAVERALAAADADPRIPRDRAERLALLHHGLIPWLAGVDSETRAPRRRVARLSEIPEEARPLIDLLVEQGLLATDQMRDTGETTIEPAHEALLRQWSLLRSWLAEDFGALTRLEGIQRAARDWANNKRDTAWLTHMGGRLEEAERLNLRPDLAANLAQADRDYLAACRAKVDAERREHEEELARERARLAEIAAAQARTARLQRRGRLTLAAVAVAVIIAIVTGVFQHRNNVALQRSLAGDRLALSTARANIMAQLAAFEQLRGHDSFVSSAAYSPDGKRIVTASWDTTARIWDAATGKQLLVLRGHDDYVNAAAFSPDGTRVVTASHDRTARVWDAATGKQLLVLKGHGGDVKSAAFSPDGKRIVTASADKTARIWDAATGKPLAALTGHDDMVNSAAFSPDGNRIVTASSDWTARIWDAATGKQLQVLRGHQGSVAAAAFNPDGKLIVTAAADSTARIWLAATGTDIAVLRGHEGAIDDAAFSPDGKRIVTASLDRTARIWDVLTGSQITTLRGHGGEVKSAAFSPDGTRVVTASDDRTARIWDVHVETMSTGDLIAESCQDRLTGLSRFTRDEMRLAGYPDTDALIDVCRATGSATSPS